MDISYNTSVHNDKLLLLCLTKGTLIIGRCSTVMGSLNIKIKNAFEITRWSLSPEGNCNYTVYDLPLKSISYLANKGKTKETLLTKIGNIYLHESLIYMAIECDEKVWENI